MTTATELNQLGVEDLQRRSNELRETLFKNELKLKTGSLASPAERTKTRRELARVLTILAAKQKASKNSNKA